MRLQEIGEFGFIRRISRGCLIRPQNILKAIGDDAAAFTVSPDVVLVTTDLLVERIHFLRRATTGFDLGYKSLAVNLSDIAAMGGIPREAFVSIAIPEDCTIAYLDELYRGIKSLAAEFDVNILGGDTTSSKVDLIINISVVGSVPEDEILFRDTAQEGDIIFSTGSLGDSRAGLHLLLHEIAADTRELQELVKAHVLPMPRLREGRFLASRGSVHAAIDVSDGLSSDLGHITRESGVGARLYHEKIPISENLKQFCRRFQFNPIEFALAGGEDYTLLCTVSPDRAAGTEQEYQSTFNQPLYPIGEITDSGKIELIDPDGQVSEIAPAGWDHFKDHANP